MAIFRWDGVGNHDLKQLGETFDFRSDVLQISNPDLQAHQFDLVEVGTDMAIVLSRDVDGTPLAAADVTYAYIPNMIIRQIGVDAGGASQNIVMSNGGQLWVGARDTDSVLDNQANVIDLSSASDSSQVWGLGGADTIDTGSGDDRVYGNVGSDDIDGGAGNDSLYGGQDSDTVSGGSGNDNVAGDLGADNLNGGSGNDILYGGAGNDVIETGTGNDTVFAGADADSLTINNSATGDKLVYMDKGQDTAEIVGTTGDHFVYMGENNDTASLSANSGDIYVSGDGGNDVLEAQNSGSDTLDGGDDDDVLAIGDGSIGDKTLIGGEGNDEIYINDDSGDAFDHIIPNTHVTVSGGGGADFIDYDRGLFITDANDGGSGKDEIDFDGQTALELRDLSIQNIETVNFLGLDNRVVFADGNNSGGVTVTGGEGNDVLDASAESSSAYWLDGGSGGEDTLMGGAGADTLVGGSGGDLLDGGDGGDIYILNHTHEGVDRVEFSPDDTFAIVGTEFSMTAYDGYIGTTAAGTDAAVNLFVSTGGSYTLLDALDNFFGGGDFGTINERPFIFAFENNGVTEVWQASSYRQIMEDIVSQTDNPDMSMLAELQFAGSPPDLTLDQFVIL